MAAQRPATVDDITAVLREQKIPMRALDIARELTVKGIIATKADVNRLLPRGPHEKVGDPKELPPRWQIRANTLAQFDTEGLNLVQIDRVGIFGFVTSVSDELLDAIFGALAKHAVPENANNVRFGAAPANRRIKEAAARHGYKVADD